jgi:hypothetical protein
MRKGFFASVATLAAGAGVALGQGTPSAPPAAPPGYAPPSGPRGPAPAGPIGGDPNSFLGGPGYPAGPGGYPAGPGGYSGSPGGYPAGPGQPDLPPAGEMPLYGQVAGPDSQHPFNPAAAPQCGNFVGQIHKAAGGPDRWWVDIEENIWTVRSMPIAYPLLTTAPAGSSGAVNQPGVTVIYGDNNVNYGSTFNVLRLTGGLWDQKREWGLELSGWISEQRTDNFDVTVPVGGQTVLARPVINSLTGLPTGFLITSPPDFGGQAHVGSQLHMGGAEADIMRNLMYCDQFKLNLIGGIRYVDVTESLAISSTSSLPNAADPNNPILSAVADSFRTHNQFLGGQLGLETELRRGRFFVDLTGKIAIGNMHEHWSVDGNTTQTIAGATAFTQGGLLALASNSGTFTRNEFAYVPEGTIKFGYQWTQRISTYIGANGLYLSRVVRPGEQIDPVVNPVLVPSSNQFGGTFGTLQPQPTNRVSDFWAMGATLGMSIRY